MIKFFIKILERKLNKPMFASMEDWHKINLVNSSKYPIRTFIIDKLEDLDSKLDTIKGRIKNIKSRTNIVKIKGYKSWEYVCHDTRLKIAQFEIIEDYFKNIAPLYVWDDCSQRKEVYRKLYRIVSYYNNIYKHRDSIGNDLYKKYGSDSFDKLDNFENRCEKRIQTYILDIIPYLW